MIRKTANENSIPLFPRNILLVEDNPADIRLIKEVLRNENNKKLHAVNDGEDALKYLNEECNHESKNYPNLIILDINLPKMNGIEFLKEIKNNENLSKIPVIIFTTSSLEENKIECFKKGANAYITKPVNFEGFKPLIKLLNKF